MFINKNEVGRTVQSFEDLKHIDENGVPYWNARELSKALGYERYRNIEPAIERAKQSIETAGKNVEDHMAGSRHMIQAGKGASREVDDYKLTQYGSYLLAMNADPHKSEVAIAQEFFAQSGAVANKINKIAKSLDDTSTLENRSSVRVNTRSHVGTLLTHDVPEDKIGIVLDAGDRGFFGMSTKEIKESNDIPENRPVADFMGNVNLAYKNVAILNATHAIEKQDARGVEHTSEISYEKNKEMRNMMQMNFGKTPEEMMTCEDIKLVEKRKKKELKEREKQLDRLSDKYGF